MYVLSHKYLLNKLLMPKDSHLRGSAKGDPHLLSVEVTQNRGVVCFSGNFVPELNWLHGT